MSDLPLVAGEVVGWRAWGVIEEGRNLALVSLFHGARWPTDDWLRAVCQKLNSDEPDPHGCEESPGVYCVCGVYGARDREHLTGLRQFGRPTGVRYTMARPLTIIGQVALAGVVIPGWSGWRAARGRPLHLWVPYTHWRVVDRLVEAYRVPVGLSNTLVDDQEEAIGGNRS
jgi:hypothetical protein